MSTRIDIPATEDGAAPHLVPFPGTERPAEAKQIARRRWPTVAAAATALLVAIAAIVWWAFGSGPTVRYTTVAVTTGAVTRAVTATGTVNPVLTIIIGSYVSGVIQDVTCDYNTQVERGQSCAKIDPRPLQTTVDQAKANLAVARAQLEKDKASLSYAKLTLDRAATLLQTSAVSKDSYDAASSNYDQAVAQIALDQATIQQRQSALDAAQVNLDYTNIVSPVDGTVVSRNVTIGQTVAASFQTPTLFLIATDLTKMQVDANVSESDIGGVAEGDKATFTVDAFPKRTFEGTVTQVRQSPQTIQNVVTYDVVVSVDNADLALKPGLTAATRIVVDRTHRGAARPESGAALRTGRTGYSAHRTAPGSGCCATTSPRAFASRPASTTTIIPKSFGAISRRATRLSFPNKAIHPRLLVGPVYRGRDCRSIGR